MEKLSTGIQGLDEITGGGFPRSRVTLVAGGAGCGKSLLLLTAVVKGAAAGGVPAVFLSFEERPEDILENAASIGLDLQPLIQAKMLRLDHIARPQELVHEAGSYTLEGLRLRIELALKTVDASVLAVDTIEALYGMFSDTRAVRQELTSLFSWLKGHGITTILSGEQGDGPFTRHGLEEYVSDCVVLLDQRLVGDVATRRLRVVKYRGTDHATNEFPFLIDSQGITVMPLSTALLDYSPFEDLISTGIEALDTALGGGVRRGSSVLVTGASGTGKSLLAANFVAAACRQGETALVVNLEESPQEYVVNTAAAGIDLRQALTQGRLNIRSVRPTLLGLEQHLVETYRLIEQKNPKVVIIDPLSSFAVAGSESEVYRTLIRLIDHLKRKEITALLTSEQGEDGLRPLLATLTSIIDVWLSLDWDRKVHPYKRSLLVRKRRGSGHAKGHLTFDITARGFEFEGSEDD